MITKSTFITIMNECDRFYGETWDTMQKLGINTDCDPITRFADTVLEVIDKEVDPDRLAAEDKYCDQSESYLFEWLFGENEFNNICATAEDLWNYISAAYAKKASADYGKQVSGEPYEEE